MRIDGPAQTRLTVLKAIRRQGPISRVELARATNLGGATITEVTGGLVDRGLITQERRPLKGKGRPQILLSINPEASAVIGASLGPDGDIELSLVGLGGNLLKHSFYELGRHARITDLTNKIGEQLRRFIGACSDSCTHIASVALSLPGTIESPAGIVHWIPTMEHESVPVGQQLTDFLGLPVTVENDVDCLSRAEHWFGALSIDDFTVIEIGINLGMAEYVDGVARFGATGMNSEFSHVKSLWDGEGRSCFCGGKGCLNTYASGAGILRSSQADANILNFDGLELAHAFPALAAAAAEGNATALGAFHTAGRHLGVALANLINIRDVGTVLIRSTVPQVIDLMKEALDASLQDHCLPQLLARTTIDYGAAMDGWRWRGAAALALENIYLEN
jgi:predicted NBD/HSP70 family sugar kinase